MVIQHIPRALIILPGILLVLLSCHQIDAYYRVTVTRAGNLFSHRPWGESSKSMISIWSGRGGDAASPDVSTEKETEEVSLDDKVHAAMRKLGLTPPSSDDADFQPNAECEDGVCPAPSSSAGASTSTPEKKQEDIHTLVKRIAKDMNVDPNLAMAAVGATSEILVGDERRYDEDAARDLIQQELNMIDTVSEDSDEVKQLVSEGYDMFLSRRALAFAEMNMNDARAILIADQQDEEEEEAAAALESQKGAPAAEVEPKESKPPEKLKTVAVNTNFDPTAPAAISGSSTTTPPGFGAQPSQSQSGMKPPTPAKKADVVFDATSAEVQKLVLESPVPVLLDVYADWCGPCKALTPALEEMAVRAGGMFRLVKINTDNERAISAALEVTSLPTVFAIKDGKILNNFQGMPRSDDFMKKFMMGLLMPGAMFDPPVSTEDQDKFAQLSSKLVKTAGAACFSFSLRERLQDRTVANLDKLAAASTTKADVVDVEDSVKVLRSLLSNVIRDPYGMKFRKVNLQNKVLAAKIAAFPQCISILKSVGFVDDAGGALILGKNAKVVNVAPLLVVRDCIDKWIDKNRYELAKAARKRKDELDRAHLAAEREEAGDEEEEESDCENEEDEQAKNACSLKVRVEGKNKIHEVALDGDAPLTSVLDVLPISIDEGEEFQLTCVAKRLVVKSTDEESMQKSLREHRLLPAASLVLKVVGETVDTEQAPQSASGGLAERAAAKRRKKGSHTMQTVGIYGKDDNSKGELIDGGGGTLFEHDVTDDESEGEPESNSDEETNGSKE